MENCLKSNFYVLLFLLYCEFLLGNIFVGQTESPLLIRPYIQDLTTSELHAIMTAGFGTIAGSVLGAYLGFGVSRVCFILRSMFAHCIC